jgi:plastocyanin
MTFRRFGIPGMMLPLILVWASVCRPSKSEASTVEAQVVVKHAHGKSGHSGNEDVVVWMMTLDRDVSLAPARMPHYKMIQKDKRFHPHVLAVPLGAPVDFPNLDPWFHNVFSLYKGERFDLGLYEAGASRTVRFDRPGVSFIFCNIHPEMSAYVLALETPYFAVSNDHGLIRIAGVPAGRYRIQLWFERAESAETAKLSREVMVTDPTTSLGTIEVRESPLVIPPHTDKHGQPYQTDRTPY